MMDNIENDMGAFGDLNQGQSLDQASHACLLRPSAPADPVCRL